RGLIVTGVQACALPIFELRWDLVRDLDADRMLALKGKPKLITVRSRQQGGAARPAEREPLLRKALAAGVAYVDLEFGERDLVFRSEERRVGKETRHRSW